MCGLVGIVDFTKLGFYEYDKETLMELLYLNSMRGQHSTGVFGIDKNTMRPDIFKVVGGPWEMESYKDFDTFKDNMKSRYTAVIGHGRFATHGAITARNAHPFVRGHISLVHNGVLDNFNDLKKEDKKFEKFEVDSDLIANLFATLGEKEALSKIRGPYALIWHNQKEGVLRFCRNYMRPLYIMRKKLRDQILLSSEEANLYWITKKKNLDDKIDQVDPYVLYTVHYDTGKIDEEPLQREPVYVHPYNSMCEYQEDEDRPVFPLLPMVPEKPIPSLLKNINKGRFKSETVEHPVEYQVQGFKAALGARIPFKFRDYSKFGSSSYIVRGAPFHNVLVDISGHFPGDIASILEAEALTGKVTNIVSLKEGLDYLARVFVNEIKPLDASIVKDNFVELADMSRINLFRFHALAKKGCSKCSSAIYINDANKILVVGSDKIYCPTCSKELPS